MKKINIREVLEYLMALVLGVVCIGGPIYLVYKLFSGIYHLLDKLIDKI